jgi:hypothetical protein
VSTRTCSACGNDARVLRRAVIIGDDGSSRGLVCRKCEALGTLLVPKRRPEVIKKVVRNTEDLDKAIGAVRALRRVCDDDRRADGLDQALLVMSRVRPL